MESLFKRQRRFLERVSTEIVREVMYEINWDRQLISIRGNRGVGKTTLMLQYIKLNYPINTTEVLYCSLDTMYFSSHTLIELVDKFVLYGGKRLMLDEVHKYPNWSREVKEIYDTYPELKVAISGSSLLHIINADADLSRRCRPYEIRGLSFREYLIFYHRIKFGKHNLKDLLDNADDICSEIISKIKPLPLFKQYLHEGYYPFYKQDDEDYCLTIENIINFVVDQELPSLCGVDPAMTRKIKSLLQIIAVSVPFELDITKIGTMLELNRNTIMAYLRHLSEAGLIMPLYSDLKSVKRMQKPDKIYIHDPNMLVALAKVNDCKVGTVRETFAVNQLSAAHQVEYGKEAGDYKVDSRYTFEVGGRDKSFMQIADIADSYILADDIDFPIGKKLPLWLIGFLY